ncbi:hypothetical protein, conserved [Babesia bigemina]|uniref:Uncharacterized protein n=1 Tax=Babesia bigemina TaxID=5866 RepID=A0A061CZA8_BABBI|nr:hypothetical protein, conserved [Babesia bigemina]CDR93758.1 hypothetical protein, conserved [Babesia bigemina]|eukprot:XP_012765944.1 hypothetical protein, conserved [Babesia bigemina]
MPSSSRGSQHSGSGYTLDSELEESPTNTPGSLSRQSYDSKLSRSSSRRSNAARGELDHEDVEALSERQQSSRSSAGSANYTKAETGTRLTMGGRSDKSSMHLASFFTNKSSRSSGGGTDRSESSRRSSARSSDEGEEYHRSRSRSSVSSRSKERSSSKSSRSSASVDVGPYSKTQVNSPVADDRIQQACSKYGLDNDSLQEILEGRHRSQRSDASLSNRDQGSENGETSPDSFRDEMLVYLLQQQLKLKAELKAQKSRGHGSHSTDGTPVRSGRSFQSDGSGRSSKGYKALEEVTPNELRSIQEGWGGDSLRDQESNAPGTPKKQGTRSNVPTLGNSGAFTLEDTYSSSGASRREGMQQQASHAGGAPMVADEPPLYARNSRTLNADEMGIQNEASSLHNEIEQIIDSLASSGMDQLSDGAMAANQNLGMRQPPFPPQYPQQFSGAGSGQFSMHSPNQPPMHNGQHPYMNSGSHSYMNSGSHSYMNSGSHSYMNSGSKSYTDNGSNPYVNNGHHSYDNSGSNSCMNRMDAPYINSGSNSYMNRVDTLYDNSGSNSYMNRMDTPYDNSGSNSYTNQMDNRFMYPEDEHYVDELPLPIKVPTKDPKPDVMDAMVMTDQTARENELHAYERLNRELEEEAFDNQGAYQTDNTRITKDGISWEITESYLKEEERRMLLEQKRAQMLKRLKEAPYAKTQTLQDHYAKWAAKKASMPKPRDGRPEERVGSSKSFDKDEAFCQVPCNVIDPVAATCGAPIFRRTRGNSRQRQSSNHSTDSKQTPPPRQADYQIPKAPRLAPIQPPMKEAPCSGDATPSRRDIYIKGSWDPHTGALRISNDLDSSQNTDKTRILDDYVDFLKQNPGNWSREPSLDETPLPPPMVRARAEDPPTMKPDIAKEVREAEPEPYTRRSVSATESIRSEKSLTLTSSSSSGSQGDLYENDEFYPPSGPLPGDFSGVGFASPAQQPKYAMGFSDPYMPPVRSASDLYSSSMAHLAVLNGARASSTMTAPVPASNPEERSHHHHYHYHCSERRHRTCPHRRRHGCRHKHRSSCSHKKHSHAHGAASDDCEHIREHRKSPCRGRSMATMTSRDFEPAEKPMPAAERQETEMTLMSPKSKSSRSSPSFFCKSPSPRLQSSPVERSGSGIRVAAPFDPCFDSSDDGKHSSHRTEDSDEAPLSFRDIITTAGRLKSTDFVKVTMYHSPNAENDVAEQQPAEAQAVLEPEVHVKPSGWCCAETTKAEETPAEQPQSDGVGLRDDATVRADSTRSSMCRAPSPTCTAPWSTSPVRYPHVFSRRVHVRTTNSPKVCVSPLAKLENGECPNLCKQPDASPLKVCYDSEAESSEQFTFRDSRPDDSKQANAPPIFKTRVLYVGNN